MFYYEMKQFCENERIFDLPALSEFAYINGNSNKINDIYKSKLDALKILTLLYALYETQ